MPATANELTMVYLLKMLAFVVCGKDTALLYHHSKSKVINVGFSWPIDVIKSDSCTVLKVFEAFIK